MKTLKLLCGLLLSSPSLMVLACEHPSLPQIPADDRIEGEEEQAIQSDTLRYISETAVYVACIQAEYEAAKSNDAPPLHLSLLATRNNTAVAELEAMRAIYEARVGSIEELVARAPQVAQPDSADTGGVNCIPAGPGFRYMVAGGQNVVFYTRTGEIYRVNLDHCPVLTRNSDISFATTGTLGGQLCNGSNITSENGTTCRLDSLFYPISQDEADELLR
jgi:hypothetical protein